MFQVSRKMLELRNEFNKAAGHKITRKKSAVFVNSNNKLSEKKLRKQFYFKNVKKNKILRNKFNQGSKRSIH